MGKYIISKEVNGEVVLQWEAGGSSRHAMSKAREYAEYHPNSHIVVAKIVGEFDVIEDSDREFGDTSFINEIEYSLED